ncbi:MAG: O-antigen ligase family protein [Chitinophagaceae bacterium]|nr:O-antigen ligase family protein [Chitinophagaceae bacterium]
MKITFFDTLFFYSLCLIAFFIPLFYNLQSISIGVLVASWILSGQYKNIFQNPISTLGHNIWWLILFLFYLISIIYSQNQQLATTDITRKLSFVIFPLVISSWQFFDKHKMNFILWSFILGVFVAFYFCLMGAFFQFDELGISALFNDNFASHTHNNAVILSSKVFFALILLALFPFENKYISNWQSVKIFLILILFIFLILLSSKTILILAVFFLIWYFIFYIKISALIKSIGIVLTIGSLSSLLLLKDSPLLRRYHDATDFVNQKGDQKYDITSVDNFSKRLAMWKAAKENLQNKTTFLIGVGAGDTEEAQKTQLCSPTFSYKNFYNFCPLHSLNLHNMYLQTWLASGIGALFSLLMLSWLSTYIFYRKKIKYATLFFALFSFYMLQESALQPQSGIVFFSFFSVLLFNFHRFKIIKK